MTTRFMKNLSIACCLAFTGLFLNTQLITAQQVTIRDEANMFSEQAKQDAETRLKQIREKSQLPIAIQTRPGSEGESPAQYAVKLAKTYAGKGLYVLILKNDRKIEVLWSNAYSSRITNDDKDRIRKAIGNEFKTGNFDAGLNKGIEEISTLAMRFPTNGDASKSTRLPSTIPNRPQPAANQQVKKQGGISLLPLLFLGGGLIILFSVLRNMFGARPYNGGMNAGRPGMGAGGYGGGYGGGGGGGFFSGMLGGLGGAVLGNWAYDRLSGHDRHGHDSMGSNMGGGSWSSPGPDSISEQKEDQWFGADDGGDWGGSGGDSGGWSGMDSGGDWGGGGSDFGGGGGTDW